MIFLNPYWIDSGGDAHAYWDPIGHGTVFIETNNVGRFHTCGYIKIGHRNYVFNEMLDHEEILTLGQTVALVINVKYINDKNAELWIGLKVLKSPKEVPQIAGGAVRIYKIPINGEAPFSVGYDFEGKVKKDSRKIEKIKYPFFPTGIDRADNGSFVLKEIIPNSKYHLIGVYTYLDKVFEINEVLELNKELGVF